MKVLSITSRTLSAWAVAATLVACGSVVTTPQTNALDAAVARMGEPRARYALENGQRLFFAVRPGEVDSLDFDHNGALLERHRVFSRDRFAALAKRRGDAAAVQLEFGPPGRKSVLEDGGGLLWTYSWREYGTWLLAKVWFDKAGALQRVEMVDDPKADDRYL